MAKSRLALPLLMLTISAGGLLSMNCGILFAPVIIPQVMIDNTRQHFEIDIVDPGGQPLTDVTVTLRKTYEYWEPIAGEDQTSKIEVLHPTNIRPLSIDRFAYVEIDATVEKPGFITRTFHFSRGHFSGDVTTTVPKGPPRGTITLAPVSAARQP